MTDEKIRSVFLCKNYFADFYNEQRQKVKDKILWTFRIIETIQRIPEEYLKHIEGTNGLYEIRVNIETIFFAYFASLTRANL